MKGKFLLALSIVLALGILIILNYRENGVKTHTSYRVSSIQGFHLARKDGDKLKWELTAKSSVFPEGKKEILLKDLTVKIYHNPNVTLTGGEGNYNIDEKNLVINKPVEIIIDNSRLTTDSLTWHGEEEIITTPDSVRLVGKNFLMEGKGLTVKVRDQQVKILKDVKGIFYR